MFDLAAAARSESLSWNRAWGWGSRRATGEGGQRPWSAAGAGRTRAAQGGCWLLAGVGEGFPVVLSEMATAAGNAPGPHRGGVNSGCAGGDYDGCRWGSVPVVLPGVATAARNAHYLCSCVPKDPHLGGAAEGCGPQVRELGLLGAGNQVFRPLLAHSRSSPTWRSQKGLALGVKAFTAPPLC